MGSRGVTGTELPLGARTPSLGGVDGRGERGSGEEVIAVTWQPKTVHRSAKPSYHWSKRRRDEEGDRDVGPC